MRLLAIEYGIMVFELVDDSENIIVTLFKFQKFNFLYFY